MSTQPKQNRLSIIFQTANLDSCEQAIFAHIDGFKLSERGELYRKAFKTGMVISMVDERLIDLIPILATKDDPKKSFTAAMKAVDIDLAWSANDLTLVGYQRRIKLTPDMLKAFKHDENGWTHWQDATIDDYEKYQSDPSVEVRPIYAPTINSAQTVNEPEIENETTIKDVEKTDVTPPAPPVVKGDPVARKKLKNLSA